MKITKLIMSILIVNTINLYAQEGILPTIQKLQGVWLFQEGNIKAFKIINTNKALEIIYTVDDQTSHSYGTPYSYFGFWNPETHTTEPKHLSELEKSGVFIRFYDDLGRSYDEKGNLFNPTRSCGMSINEDSDDPIPSVLRFYYKGDPDVYSKVKAVPAEVLYSLKQNPPNWKKYLDLICLKERIIKVSKAFIYQSPQGAVTKSYLLNKDQVAILAQKGNWLHIRFYGKKITEGWIKAADVQ